MSSTTERPSWATGGRSRRPAAASHLSWPAPPGRASSPGSGSGPGSTSAASTAQTTAGPSRGLEPHSPLAVSAAAAGRPQQRAPLALKA
eukprot:7143888-Lingulodinium_polyedra.AAC.1